MKKLEIKWQRLVYKGKTCPRCSHTEKEIKKAVSMLKRICKNYGINLVFKKEKISKQEFEKNPLNSNKILINNKPIEKYLNAKTSKSKCCDVCGPVECRTLVVNKNQYETIPANLIIQAGLDAMLKILSKG
ncbi:MAG: DUF2703 domain-containing protein [Endomicrobiia bacterium]